MVFNFNSIKLETLNALRSGLVYLERYRHASVDSKLILIDNWTRDEQNLKIQSTKDCWIFDVLKFELIRRSNNLDSGCNQRFQFNIQRWQRLCLNLIGLHLVTTDSIDNWWLNADWPNWLEFAQWRSQFRAAASFESDFIISFFIIFFGIGLDWIESFMIQDWLDYRRSKHFN